MGKIHSLETFGTVTVRACGLSFFSAARCAASIAVIPIRRNGDGEANDSG